MANNKRVSELAQITAPELSGADLFLLADVSAQQSKKLTLSDLSSFILTDGNLTASLLGTASWANNAQTASVALVAISASFSATASFALNGGTGGVAVSASWASSSLSASYAKSASFVSVATAATASFATQSRFADSASFVIYTGINNGTIQNAISAQNSLVATSASFATSALTSSNTITASYAISTSFAANTLTSDTASHALFAETASVGITTNLQSSASWASQSLSSSYADIALDALTAVTASYVLPNAALQQYGIFTAISQSNYISQLDSVDIDPFLTGPATTSIEVAGTMVAPYTSSILLNESVSLYVLDRATGISYNLDTTPIFVNIQGQFSSITASIQASVTGQLNGSTTGSIMGPISGSVSGSISGSTPSGSLTGSFNGSLNSTFTGSISSSVLASYNGSMTGSVNGSVSALLSGSIKFPFLLMGQLYLNSGSYMLYISASTNKIFIEPSRLSRFSVSSNVGQFNVHTGEPMQLTTDSPTDLITFSSSLGGPFTDTAAHMVTSGSGTILTMDISNVSGIRYIWSLNNLTSISSFGNTLVSDVGGMPNSIVTMSLQGGGLTKLFPLSQSAVSILNFSQNSVVTFPALPPTMSYINCNNNPILALPAIPFGVTQLFASSTAITTPPSSLPSQIVSMSFSGNSNLNLWLTTLPSSLSSFDVSSCNQLTALPTIPSNVMFLDVSFGAFTDIAQDNICANLVSNGLLSGSLNLLGNAPVLPTTVTRIATLQSRAWTVTY